LGNFHFPNRVEYVILDTENIPDKHTKDGNHSFNRITGQRAFFTSLFFPWCAWLAPKRNPVNPDNPVNPV
jgi:hypothetical protein